LSHGIESEIRNFISRYIDSVEQLEILLLLRNAGDKQWTAAEINDRLQSNLSSIQSRLKGLCDLKFIMCTQNVFQYQKTKDPDMERILDKLAHVYKEKRNRIIEIIFSKPQDKLRDFSDAFRIRKDPEDG
jgi:hypothetical protein